MSKRSQLALIWGGVAALTLLILLPVGPQLYRAWVCYQLHENGVREQAQVLHKLERQTFAVYIVEGPHAGESCTADTSPSIYEGTEIGDTLEVVYVEEKPGSCELSTTIAASAVLLWAICAALAFVILVLIATGILLSRAITRPAHPALRMDVDPREVRCPRCGKQMDEGVLIPLSGVHWRQVGAPIGLPHAFSGLPGSVGWRGRPCLHAFRCTPCEIVTFRYGHPSRS